MTTAASPVSVRDQVLAFIGHRLGAEPALQDRLAGIGGAALADILCTLETVYDIGIDVDEVLPNGTVGVLAELVERRARAGGRIVYWDDERVRRGLSLCTPRPAPAPIQPVAIVLPPWPPEPPAFKAETPPARTPCAVPSDAAWDAFLAIQAREARDRHLAFAIVLLATVVAAVGGCWWVDHLQGLR